MVDELAGSEAKTTAVWKGKEWDGEEMPLEYILQCYHYLMVTGWDRWYMGVLIGNTDFNWKPIEKDEKLQAEILRREVEFWNEYVQTKTPPSVITKRDGDVLAALFPKAEPEKEILLPDEANILCETLEGLEADGRNVEGLIEETKNKLKNLLQDAAIGRTSLHEIRWLNQPHNSIDTKSLKEHEPEMYSKYLRSKTIRRFSCKKIESKEI